MVAGALSPGNPTWAGHALPAPKRGLGLRAERSLAGRSLRRKTVASGDLRVSTGGCRRRGADHHIAFLSHTQNSRTAGNFHGGELEFAPAQYPHHYPHPRDTNVD